MLEAALLPRKLAYGFMLDPGPNPVPELEPDLKCILVPVPLRQNVAVPVVPVPVPEHWQDHSWALLLFSFVVHPFNAVIWINLLVLILVCCICIGLP
jgi:hypothetical protein